MIGRIPESDIANFLPHEVTEADLEELRSKYIAPQKTLMISIAEFTMDRGRSLEGQESEEMRLCVAGFQLPAFMFLATRSRISPENSFNVTKLEDFTLDDYIELMVGYAGKGKAKRTVQEVEDILFKGRLSKAWGQMSEIGFINFATNELIEKAQRRPAPPKQ